MRQRKVGALWTAVALWLAALAPTVAAEPLDPLAVMIEGQAALARGALDEAAALYGRGLDNPAASDRHRVSFHIGRSRVRTLQGRFGDALADADAAVALADRAEPAMARGNVHAIRGFLLVGVGRRAEAIADLETAERLLQSPDDDYAALLTEMMQHRPDQVEALRRQTEILLESVREKLEELQQTGERR